MAKNESLLSKALGRFGFEVKSGKPERRSSLENPQTPLSYPSELLLDMWNGGRTDSGIRVSEMTALQTAVVFQCVTIISNAIASHPLNVYTRSLDDGIESKKIAYSHPLYDLLHSEPNPEMTSSTWRRTLMCHKLLWGNGYAEIERDQANRIIAIWPRNPSRTRPVRLTAPWLHEGTMYPPGTMCYETFESMGDSQIMEQDSSNQISAYRRLVLAEDMIHLPGLSLDGRLGQDVIILARQAIGLGLATEKYGAKFFGNGAIPSGLLTAAGDMTEIQWETLRRSWQEAQGGENAHKVGVLPPGVTFTKTGATPNEGQMLETRNNQIAEIARFFNVPPHMVGINADDAGKSTVEQSAIEFKLFTTDPHAMDFKQELKRKLFPKVGQSANKYTVGIDFTNLMYPDAASRATFYGSGKQWGYLNTDDIRVREGMNPTTDGSGQKFMIPNNMVDAGTAAIHSDQVADGLNDGTLAATPPGVTPVGSHPIVKAQEKAAKQQAAAGLEHAKVNAAAQVAIAKHNANAPSKDNKDGSTTQSSNPKNQAVAKGKKRDDATKVFGPMFRDAVGRASNRKKATQGDYVTIFAPLLSAMATALHDEYDSVESSEFIRGYTAELFATRVDKWGENLDEVASQELNKVLDSILGVAALEVL